MKRLLTIISIAFALFVIAPFALGAGYAFNDGDLDVRLWSHSNETKVFGTDNHIVSAAGNRNRLTTTTMQPAAKTSVGSMWADCFGGLVFLSIIVIFVVGMVRYGLGGVID